MNNIFTDTPIRNVEERQNNQSSSSEYQSLESRGIYHQEILDEPVSLLISLRDKSLKNQLSKIIESLDNFIGKYWDTKSILPKVLAIYIDDGPEVLMNWTFKFMKLGISISKNKNDSIWYYALENTRGGLSSEYGQLSNEKDYSDLDSLIKLAIKTNN